jgi:hypothetical protein
MDVQFERAVKTSLEGQLAMQGSIIGVARSMRDLLDIISTSSL